MRHAALQRSAMPSISAAADVKTAAPFSSRRCRLSRSLWKVLTFVGPLLWPGLEPGFFVPVLQGQYSAFSEKPMADHSDFGRASHRGMRLVGSQQGNGPDGTVSICKSNVLPCLKPALENSNVRVGCPICRNSGSVTKASMFCFTLSRTSGREL